MTESNPKSPTVQRVVPTEEELRTLPSASYRCHICNLQVKTKSNLRAHMVKTHKLIQDERDVAFLTKKKVEVSYFYYCPIPSCKHRIDTKNGFSKFSRLKQHYQIVHMKKSFQCNTCGQLFATPTTQAYHSKTCGLSYECLVCHRKYRQKKFLNQHARRSGHKISGSGRMPENNTHSYPPNVGSDATTTKPTVAPNTVQPILLPILILPLDVPADKISTSTIMSAFSRVLANTCGSINLPSAVAAAQSRTSYLPTTLTENQAIGNFINQSIQDGSLSISAATATALQDTVMTSVALQQNSQGRVSCAFAKVADVGTATMCLTDACVQTDFYGQSASAHLNKSAPLISVKTGTDNDNIADVFFKMADFSVGTSPPALISAGNSPPCFIAPVARADTYMTSAKSIQLQYPEMNSNGTMTQPHQFACGDQLFGQKPDRTEFISAPQQAPQSSLEGHFQSQPPPFCHMFSHTAATATSSCSGESSQSCYTPPSSIASSFCATPNPSSSNSVFSFNPPRSLIDISQQFSWPEQSRGVMANSCISSEPDYLNRQAVNNEYLSRRDQQPTFSSDIPARGSDAAETQYTASWVSLHPQADLPSNELSIGCGVSTPTLPTAPKTSTSLCHANSVAVETTVDLMNFNDNNAGNCCWSPADSFSHMQTQTTGDAELDQWLNSVHTQTAFQQTASGVAASSSASWLSTDNGVCVGVNTDLRTLEGCNQFV